MTIKEFLIDLKWNIEFLIEQKVEIINDEYTKIRKFSDYYLVDFLSGKIETLGKIITCSPLVAEEDGVSRIMFSYAILKLKAFTEYRKFIYIKNKPTNPKQLKNDPIERLKGIKQRETVNTNLDDAINLLDAQRGNNVTLDFYSDFRCSFQHISRPTKNINYDSEIHPMIFDKGKWLLSTYNFANDFIKAIDEICNTSDVLLKSYISDKFLNIIP